MWLVRHLELIRKFTVDDLRIAKTLCVKVFPPHYNIFEFYINLYREAISNRLEEIIEQGLQNQEHVTILNWATQEYSGWIVGIRFSKSRFSVFNFMSLYH